MKKQLILAAVAVVAMASCAKNEAVEESVASATAVKTIELDTFIERSTKGSSVTTSALQTSEGFGVVGYRHDDVDASYADNSDVVVIMDNAAVKYSSTGSWTYEEVDAVDGPVYSNTWNTTEQTGNEDQLSFFAYYPASLSDDNYITSAEVSSALAAQTKVTPSISFTLDETIASQVDILAAKSLDNVYSPSPSPIQFEFAHILSKIGFTAQSEMEDGSDIDGLGIKSIVVTFVNSSYSGVKQNATFNFGDGSAAVADNWEFPATNTYLATAGEDIAATTVEAYKGADGYMALTTSATTDVTDSDKYMMLIPQTISADAINVKVTYQLSKSGTYETTSELVKNVYLPEMTFEMGKQYTFNLILNDNTIRFSSAITVSDWVDGTAADL